MREVSFIVLLLALSGGTAAGQAADGSIRGYVRDEQGAVLPGATITVTSTTVPGYFSAVSDAEGYYRVLNLAPGEYALEATLDNFARFRREGLVMRAGLALGVEITMKIGALSETVQVSYESPLLDATSAEHRVNISGDLQRALPLTGRRNWADFLSMVPGAAKLESSFYQQGFFYIHGAHHSSHVLLVDGADVTSANQSNSLYFGVNTDAIADVQVKTAAVDASSPLGLGMVANVVTRSGTNQLSGSAGLAYQPRAWIADNVPGGTTTKIEVVQPDVSVGGPIRRDAWWFFGSYRRLYNSTEFLQTPAELANLRALVPGFEPFDNVTEGNLWYGKVDGRLGARDLVQAVYSYDVTPGESGGGATSAAFSQSVLGGTGVSGRWTRTWNDALTTRVSASYNEKGSEITVRDPEVTSRVVYSSVFASSGKLTGNGLVATLDNTSQWSDSDFNKITIAVDSNYYRTGLAGAHEVKAGIFLQPRQHVQATSFYVNQGFAREEVVLRDPANPAAGFVPYMRQIYDTPSEVISWIDRSDNAIYVQDLWRPGSRLSVTGGVRLDWIRRTDRLFDLETQQSLEVGPRVGATIALRADNTSLIRSSWGRVHEVTSQNQTAASNTTAGYRELFDLDLNGTFETEFTTPRASQLLPNRIIDPGYHQPFVDEWTLGYAHQLPGQTTFDISLINRRFRERTAIVETNAIYDGGGFRGYRNEALNEIGLLTNNVWNTLVYTGLELQASKQTAKLQVLGGYTRQWRHIDGTWQPNDLASFLQPDTFENDRGIGRTNSSTGGNTVYTDSVSYEGWRDHVVRVAASYRAPWNLLLATQYAWQSGIWSGPIVTRLDAPDPRFGPPTVRLSNGRDVSNPLASTIRFVGPTRGDGQFALPGVHTWNVRVGRDFRFAGWRFETAIDVFNVPNLDQVMSFAPGANQTYSPGYRQGREVQWPRAAQLTFRAVF